MPKISGNKLPASIRARGIRWIFPEIVKINFDHEQKLREEGYKRGFAAGFAAASGGRKHTTELTAFKDTEWDKHCRRAGFTSQEFEEIDNAF